MTRGISIVIVVNGLKLFGAVALWCAISLVAKPGQVDGQEFADVRQYLAQAVDEEMVAGGVVLVLHEGHVVFETGFGYADIKTKEPYRVDTPAVIASISKPILGTAAFRLAESGKLDMGVSISHYLPEFSGLKLESGADATRAPSMIELFTHTSGIRSDYASGGRPWFAAWTKNQPLSSVVARYARDYSLRSEPGSRFAYSGMGTDVAARVMEVASGEYRDQVLIQEVCVPLGMKHTYYWSDERSTANIKMPTRYVRGKNKQLIVQRKRDLPAANTYSASGGTIVSTAGDLARWLMMIRNGGVHEGKRYLSEESFQNMIRGRSVGKAAQSGLFIREKNVAGNPAVVGHTGSSGTNVWVDFDKDVIGIMLTQTAAKDSQGFRVELEKRINQCFVMQLQ